MSAEKATSVPFVVQYGQAKICIQDSGTTGQLMSAIGSSCKQKHGTHKDAGDEAEGDQDVDRSSLHMGRSNTVSLPMFSSTLSSADKNQRLTLSAKYPGPNLPTIENAFVIATR